MSLKYRFSNVCGWQFGNCTIRENQMARWVLAMVLALATAPGFAEEGPPLDFFAGKYELVGRAPGADGMPFLDWVTVDVKGDRLELSACRAGAGNLKIRANRDEHEPVFSGKLGNWDLGCEYQVDRGNYARMTCYFRAQGTDTVPGLLTLWPAHWDRPDHAAGCK